MRVITTSALTMLLAVNAGVPTGAIHPKYVCVCTVSGLHTRPIYSVSWSRKNGLIATAGGDDQIYILQEVCKRHFLAGRIAREGARAGWFALCIASGFARIFL